MNQFHQAALILGGAFLLVGLVFFFLGFLRNKMIRGWTSTTGTIIQKNGSLTGMPSLYPTFTWVDSAGAEHKRTSQMRASLGPRPGTQVPIRYNPTNPDAAIIDSLAQSGRIFIFIGIGVAVIGLFVAASFWSAGTLAL